MELTASFQVAHFAFDTSVDRIFHAILIEILPGFSPHFWTMWKEIIDAI